MTEPVILVTGATGTVGSALVAQLRQTGHRVRALVRDPDKAKRFGAGVEVARADLEHPETLGPAFAGVDRLFVLSNGPMIAALERRAYAAAKAAGVTHIVKLSGRMVDADFMVPTPLSHWHADSEQRLRSLGIPWTILRPGTFASNVLAWLDRGTRGIFLPAGDGKDSLIDPRDIAAVAARLLTSPAQDGRIYEISGSELLDFATIAEKVSTATGRKVTYHDVPEETARRGLLASGMPASYAESLLCYFAGVKKGVMYTPTAAVRDLLGRPPISFDEWARDHATALAA